jgi:hypothetical protein
MKEAIRGLAARPRCALGLAAHWWAWWFDSTLGFPGEGHPSGIRGDPALGDTGPSPPAPGVHDARGFASEDPHPRLRRRLTSRGRDNAPVGVTTFALFRPQGLAVLGHPARREDAPRPMVFERAGRSNPPQIPIATWPSHRGHQLQAGHHALPPGGALVGSDSLPSGIFPGGLRRFDH